MSQFVRLHKEAYLYAVQSNVPGVEGEEGGDIPLGQGVYHL